MRNRAKLAGLNIVNISLRVVFDFLPNKRQRFEKLQVLSDAHLQPMGSELIYIRKS